MFSCFNGLVMASRRRNTRKATCRQLDADNIDGTESTQISPVCNKCHPLLSQYLIEDQRLDYIYYNHNNNRLKYKTSKILPLRINRSDLDFNKISDHDAIYTEFTYK